MNDSKKRVLVAGLLALCVAKLVWPDTESYRWYARWGEGFSLSTLVTLCGAWACCVWLWRDEWSFGKVTAVGKKVYEYAITALLILSAMSIVGFIAFALIKASVESTKS